MTASKDEPSTSFFYIYVILFMLYTYIYINSFTPYAVFVYMSVSESLALVLLSICVNISLVKKRQILFSKIPFDSKKRIPQTKLNRSSWFCAHQQLRHIPYIGAIIINLFFLRGMKFETFIHVFLLSHWSDFIIKIPNKMKQQAHVIDFIVKKAFIWCVIAIGKYFIGHTSACIS